MRNHDALPAAPNQEEPNTATTTDAAEKSSFHSYGEELTNASSTCSSSIVSNTSTCMSITQQFSSSERDNADCYADVGFMFEGLQASTLKRFSWGRTPTEINNPQSTARNKSFTADEENLDAKKASHSAAPEVRVALHVVDDEPGALQSGHYLWPAAPALAKYLIQLVSSPTQQQHTSSVLSLLQNPRNVLELGAGSALLSLTALQLMHESLQCLVVTDHDPGTLERARDNYETTLEDLLEATHTEDEQMDCINGLASIPVMFEPLEWGDEDTAERVAQAAAEHNSHPLWVDDDDEDDADADSGDDKGKAASTTTIVFPSLNENQRQEQQQQPLNPSHNSERNMFDLILGSDLLYSRDVVRPLFDSVSHLMAPEGSFLLSQSLLPLDNDTEECIQRMCETLYLQRTVLKTANNGGVQIEQFTWMKRTVTADTGDDVGN